MMRPLLFVILGTLAACKTLEDGWGQGRPVPADDDSTPLGDDDDSGPQDRDGDHISDEDEGTLDQDGDGIPNDEDDDSDGDGISDADEAGDTNSATAPQDSDGDGIPDFLDEDSDGNGVDDRTEGQGDLDGDGIHDAADRDNDGDGIDDATEMDGEIPVDSDGDGTPDWLDTESDGDGIPDDLEGADDPDGDGVPSYLDLDSDGDGFSDVQEAGADPSEPPDSDGDGFGDWEDADADNDGIGDATEAAAGTSWTQRDSDGDGFSDSAEAAVGSNPLDPSSGVVGFYAELPPRVATSVFVPFTPSIRQADVLFVLDSTCSMTEELATMAGNFADVVSQAGIPDVAWGVADFNDYIYGDLGFAAAGDKPFRLQQQVSTDASLTQSALGSLFIHDGGDDPESSMEALYQALTGRGYDQDCLDDYDPPIDVPPFLSNAADAFSGAQPGVYNPAVPGTGSLGGAGFRAGSVPIVVYTTDNWMRDADVPAVYTVPPACAGPAGANAVIDAAGNLGARLIAIGTNPTPQPQMSQLAQATGSQVDSNGDGIPEDLVYIGVDNGVVDSVIDGVTALTNAGTFDLTLQVEGDTFGFVQSINPAVFPDAQLNVTVTFEISVLPAVPQGSSDQVFVYPVQVIGDGITVLAEWELVLVVLAQN
jgi:hypothetical protein